MKTLNLCITFSLKSCLFIVKDWPHKYFSHFDVGKNMSKAVQVKEKIEKADRNIAFPENNFFQTT